MIGPKDLRSIQATRTSEEIKVDPNSKPAELSARELYGHNHVRNVADFRFPDCRPVA
jgi:hypothetical protein